MAIDDVYSLTYVSAVNGQRVVNTMHFGEVVECTDDLPAKSLCAAWEDVFLPALLLCLSEECLVQCIYARRIKPTFGIPFLVVETASPGDFVSECIPPNAAAVLSFYTDRFSRSGRGRQYISGIPASQVLDSQMNSALIGNLQDFCDLWKVPLEAIGSDTGQWSPIIYSPTLGNGRAVLQYHVSPSMGSMRSRRQPYGMVP